MKEFLKVSSWILVALFCVFADGCNCHVRIGRKQQPSIGITSKANKSFNLKFPGRSIKLTVDEDVQIADGVISIGDQQLKVTRAAIFWNGEEALKFTPQMTELEVKIIKKNLKITSNKKVLFERSY